MHEEWKQTTLGDTVVTQKGFAFKSSWYSSTGHPIVKVSDFSEDSIDVSGLALIPEETAQQYRKYSLDSGDVIVQTVGSWPTNPASVVGKCVRAPLAASGALLNQNAVKLAPINGLDRGFLFYLLRSKDFKSYIVGTAQGAASQAAITLDAVRAYTFKLPPLALQQKIAALLSAYDELIENNQRRIHILEKMARSLYCEWFVCFRVPGYEVNHCISPMTEKFPDGWKTRRLSELVSFAKGRKPQITREDPLSGDVKLLLIESLRNGTSVFTSPDKLILAETRDTIMVMDGASSCEVTMGASGAVGSTLGRFRVTDPNHFSTHALFHFLASKANEFKLKNVGAAIPHANKDYILSQEVVVPPKNVSIAFDDKCEPLQKAIEVLKLKIHNLRRVRDLLLPRLISGQIKLEAN